ncbi:MAG: ribosome biogenesis GTPase Der [Nitrospirota bacterium]
MSALVAIVGRPNVGKSALFNRMIKKAGFTAAITESTPGVTRDRNYGTAEWEGRAFSVVDTGGFYAEGLPHEQEEIARQVKEQAFLAVEEADLIVHLLDGKEGLTPDDLELSSILRKSGKKIVWAVNKIDVPQREDRIAEFYRIGADEVIPVSAVTGHGFDDFMDTLVAALPPEQLAGPGAPETADLPKIAVVGRPNAGKSTLINSLLGTQRLIVSPVPGTTRDAIDSLCTYYGKKYRFIDTAGIRRKARDYSIEGFSLLRALKSIERADVALIVLDAAEGIVEQDQRIAGIVRDYGKSAIFLLNKWDLIKEPEATYKRFSQELKYKFWFMDYAPFLTISGIEKKRTAKIFPLIDEILGERRKRIPTGELNQFLSRMLSTKPFPKYRGREVKLFYMTQVGTEPPTFALFVNYPAAVKEQQIRHIEKALRDAFSFKGTPLRIQVKARSR